MNGSLTVESASAKLQAGVDFMLSRWAALQMAIENQWGGDIDYAQKRTQLATDLFHLLTQSKEQVYIDDFEEMLEKFMLQLNTEVEDGSIGEIAEKLMIMLEECLEALKQ